MKEEIRQAGTAAFRFPSIGKWKREFFQGLETLLFLGALGGLAVSVPVFVICSAEEILHRQGAKVAKGRGRSTDYTDYTDGGGGLEREVAFLRESVSSAKSVDDFFCSA